MAYYYTINKRFFDIYPNPATHSLHISNNSNQRVHATIVDILGRPIANASIRDKNVIDISQFATGTYMLKIGNEELGYYFKKFIKN